MWDHSFATNHTQFLTETEHIFLRSISATLVYLCLKKEMCENTVSTPHFPAPIVISSVIRFLISRPRRDCHSQAVAAGAATARNRHQGMLYPAVELRERGCFHTWSPSQSPIHGSIHIATEPELQKDAFIMSRHMFPFVSFSDHFSPFGFLQIMSACCFSPS